MILFKYQSYQKFTSIQSVGNKPNFLFALLQTIQGVVQKRILSNYTSATFSLLKRKLTITLRL